MKFTPLPWKYFFIGMLCTGLLVACKKNNTSGNPANPGNPATPAGSVNADSLSDHLQFLNASKIQGAIPQAPSTSSLKMSFKDTLYLMDQVVRGVKFLHTDPAQNVSGVFLQVFIGSIGGPLGAAYYYDIPEIPEMADNDSVSVVMIGFNPSDIKLPLTFEVKIIPYDKNKQPIAQADKPVKIVEHTVNPKGNAVTCGLVLPAGEYWDWDVSFIQKPIAAQTFSDLFDFYSEPYKYFGAEGQDINGSCCNGTSVLGACPGTRDLNAKLHFATYYRIASETLTFHDDGTFLRHTFEESPIPLPDSSDFCAGGEGITRYNLNHTIYTGNYTVTPATLPPDLKIAADTLRVGLGQTSSTGGGYGNPGGIIHELNCDFLTLIQVDLEGHGQHLFKFYTHRKPGDALWFGLRE